MMFYCQIVASFIGALVGGATSTSCLAGGGSFDFFAFYMTSTRPTGCFLTLPQATIEAIRDQAAAMITEGKTMMSYADSGTSVSKQFPMDPMMVLIECRYALQILDPNQYGTRDICRVYNGLWNFRGL